MYRGPAIAPTEVGFVVLAYELRYLTSGPPARQERSGEVLQMLGLEQQIIRRVQCDGDTRQQCLEIHPGGSRFAPSTGSIEGSVERREPRALVLDHDPSH